MTEAALSFDAVTRRFGKTLALDRVSLNVPPENAQIESRSCAFCSVARYRMFSHSETLPVTPVTPSARNTDTMIAGPVSKHPEGSSCACTGTAASTAANATAMTPAN